MKNTILSVVIGLMALSCTYEVHAGDVGVFHIGLSPYEKACELMTIRQRVGQFILVEAPPRTTVVVHDAYALTEVARFQIPALQFDSAEERARRMVEPFGKMADWCRLVASRQVPAPLINSRAMRTPEFLSNMAQQCSGQQCAVLLIGSPVTLSLEEEAFSMAGGKVPSDGHIRTNVVASIYGTAEKSGRLHGCVVHYCYLREDIWTNQLVKEKVQRFWGLFISQQDGKLVNFNADLNRIFTSLMQNGLSTVGTYQLDPSDSERLEMRVIHERSIPVREEKAVMIASVPVATNRPSMSVSLPAAVVEVRAVPETNIPVRVVKTITIPQVSMVTNVTSMAPMPVAPLGRTGIAVWWQAPADLDLYVAMPGQKELYYRNIKNSYGEYCRDIRDANQQTNEQAWRTQWEYVEVSGEVPTDSLSCWVNLYKTNKSISQPITGKVRVQFRDGHIVETPFRFNVTQGNGGMCADKRQTSACWIPIALGSESTKQESVSVKQPQPRGSSTSSL